MKEERRALEDLYKRAMQKAEYLPFIKKHSDCYSVDHKKTLKELEHDDTDKSVIPNIIL